MELPSLFASTSGTTLQVAGFDEDTVEGDMNETESWTYSPPDAWHDVDCEAKCTAADGFSDTAFDLHAQCYSAGVIAGAHVPVGLMRELIAEDQEHRYNTSCFDPFQGNTLAVTALSPSIHLLCTATGGDNQNQMMVSCIQQSASDSDASASGEGPSLVQTVLATLTLDTPILQISALFLQNDDINALTATDSGWTEHSVCVFYAIRTFSSVFIVSCLTEADCAAFSVQIVDVLWFAPEKRPMHIDVSRTLHGEISAIISTEDCNACHWHGTLAALHDGIGVEGRSIVHMAADSVFNALLVPKESDSESNFPLPQIKKLTPDLSAAYATQRRKLSMIHDRHTNTRGRGDMQVFLAAYGPVITRVWYHAGTGGVVQTHANVLFDMRQLPVPPFVRELIGSKTHDSVPGEDILGITILTTTTATATIKHAPTLLVVSRYRCLTLNLCAPMRPTTMAMHPMWQPSVCVLSNACQRNEGSRFKAIICDARGSTYQVACNLGRMPSLSCSSMPAADVQRRCACTNVNGAGIVISEHHRLSCYRSSSDGTLRCSRFNITAKGTTRARGACMWTRTAHTSPVSRVLGCYDEPSEKLDGTAAVSIVDFYYKQVPELESGVVQNARTNTALDGYLQQKMPLIHQLVACAFSSATSTNDYKLVRVLSSVYKPANKMFDFSLVSRTAVTGVPVTESMQVNAAIKFDHAGASSAVLHVPKTELQNVLRLWEKRLGGAGRMPRRLRGRAGNNLWKPVSIRRWDGEGPLNSSTRGSPTHLIGADYGAAPLFSLDEEPSEQFEDIRLIMDARTVVKDASRSVDPASLRSHLRSTLQVPCTLHDIYLSLRCNRDYAHIELRPLALGLLADPVMSCTMKKLQPSRRARSMRTPSASASTAKTSSYTFDKYHRYVLDEFHEPVQVLRVTRVGSSDSFSPWFGVSSTNRPGEGVHACNSGIHDTVNPGLLDHFRCNGESKCFIAAVPLSATSRALMESYYANMEQWMLTSTDRLVLGYFECELDAVLAVSQALEWGRRKVGKRLSGYQATDRPSSGSCTIAPEFTLWPAIELLGSIRIDTGILMSNIQQNAVTSFTRTVFKDVVPENFLSKKSESGLLGVTVFRGYKSASAGLCAGIGTISKEFDGLEGFNGTKSKLYAFKASVLKQVASTVEARRLGCRPTKDITIGMYASPLEASAMVQLHYSRPQDEIGTPLPPDLEAGAAYILYRLASFLDAYCPFLRLEPLAATYPDAIPSMPQAQPAHHEDSLEPPLHDDGGHVDSPRSALRGVAHKHPSICQCSWIPGQDFPSLCGVACKLPHLLVFCSNALANAVDLTTPVRQLSAAQLQLRLPKNIRSGYNNFFDGFIGDSKDKGGDKRIALDDDEDDDETQMMALMGIKPAPPKPRAPVESTSTSSAAPVSGVNVYPMMTARFLRDSSVSERHLMDERMDTHVCCRDVKMAASQIRALPVAPMQLSFLKSLMNQWKVDGAETRVTSTGLSQDSASAGMSQSSLAGLSQSLADSSQSGQPRRTRGTKRVTYAPDTVTYDARDRA